MTRRSVSTGTHSTSSPLRIENGSYRGHLCSLNTLTKPVVSFGETSMTILTANWVSTRNSRAQVFRRVVGRASTTASRIQLAEFKSIRMGWWNTIHSLLTAESPPTTWDENTTTLTAIVCSNFYRLNTAVPSMPIGRRRMLSVRVMRTVTECSEPWKLRVKSTTRESRVYSLRIN